MLKPAAAVEACDLLGIELPTRKPRSALDIDPLMMVWAAAFAAGFIEVDRSRVTAGPSLQSWTVGTAEAVVAIWTRCALESLGLAGQTDPADLDFLVVLATLHEHGAASVDELSKSLLIGGDASDCSCPDCTSNSAQSLLLDNLDSTADVDDVVEALGEFGIAVLRGETAELTSLGHWFTDFLFQQSTPLPTPMRPPWSIRWLSFPTRSSC